MVTFVCGDLLGYHPMELTCYSFAENPRPLQIIWKQALGFLDAGFYLYIHPIFKSLKFFTQVNRTDLKRSTYYRRSVNWLHSVLVRRYPGLLDLFSAQRNKCTNQRSFISLCCAQARSNKNYFYLLVTIRANYCSFSVGDDVNTKLNIFNNVLQSTLALHALCNTYRT